MLDNKYSDILNEYMEKEYFESAVLRVFTAEDTVFSIAVGAAREDSIFDVASLTKLATSTQIVHLIKMGRLAVYDSIMEYLPELNESEFLRNRLSKVTLFNLLTHTSVIPKWYPLYTLEGSFAQRLEIALKRLDIATGVTYGDINFMLLGKIIEHCYGLPLDKCLEQDLVLPYKLGNMCYCPKLSDKIVPSSFNNAREENMCQQMGLSFDGFRDDEIIQGTPNDGNAHYYFGGVAGHAGIFADGEAYQRLCQMYMSTHCPFMLSALQDKGMGRGFGFDYANIFPNGCGHTGFTGTAIWISKDRKLGSVLFTNRLFNRVPATTEQINDMRKHIFFEINDDLSVSD